MMPHALPVSRTRRARVTRQAASGNTGEDLAISYAVARGAHVVARNWRGGHGELDLVLEDAGVLVFAEVKLRSYGSPTEAVDEAKVRKLTRAALAFLEQHDLAHVPARFDVISIVSSHRAVEIVWHKDAFEAAPDEELVR